ncbi:MAG: mechanosensitive ion channel [Thermoplasmata archaeon]
MDIWDFLPFVVVATLLTIVILGYILSWLTHVFTWIKMREDNYLTDSSIDSMQVLIKIMVVGLYLLAIIVSSSLLNPDFRWPFIYLGNFVFLFNAFVVLSFFIILSILSSSAISNFKESTEDDEDAVLKPGILEFYELFIKYGMLLLGFFIAVMVGLITIPEGEIRNNIFNFIQSDIDTAKLGTDFLSLVIILLSIYLLSKFVDIILEDFKTRSKKFQPGIIDVIKAILKYSLYWISLIITLTIILEMIQFRQLDLVIIFIIALTISIVIILGVSPATRNAICGIILLTTDSINKGDWVQIGDDNVGEVVCQGLVITSLKNRTGDIIDLPNDLIMNTYIHNFTKLGGTKIRLALSIKTSLPYGKVEEILLKSAEGLDQSSLMASGAALSVTMTDIKADCVEYTIGIWRKDPVTTEHIISEYLKRFHILALENQIIVLGTSVKNN